MSNPTTDAPGVVVARPPADLDDLPTGWSWWTAGVYTHPHTTQTVLDQPAPGWPIVEHQLAAYRRGVTERELRERYAHALHVWNGDVPGAHAVEAIRAMPPTWRERLLRERGLTHLAGDTVVIREEFASLIANDDDRWHGTTERCTPDAPGAITARPQAWRIADPAHWARRGDGRWADLDARLARAAAGTPIPDGWQLTDPQERQAIPSPWRVPLPLSHQRALSVWSDYYTVDPQYTDAEVRQYPDGRWVARDPYGQEWASRSTAEAAHAFAVQKLRHIQAAAWQHAHERAGGTLAWTGWPDNPPEPRITITSAL